MHKSRDFHKSDAEIAIFQKMIILRILIFAEYLKTCQVLLSGNVKLLKIEMGDLSGPHEKKEALRAAQKPPPPRRPGQR